MTKKFFIVWTVLLAISAGYWGANRANAVAAPSEEQGYGYESAQPFDQGDAEMQDDLGAFPEGEEGDLPFLEDMPMVDQEDDTAGIPVEK